MKRQGDLSSWRSAKKPREEHGIGGEVSGSSDGPRTSDSRSSRDSRSTSTDIDEEDIEIRRDWCEIFRKKDGKVSRRYVRCKVCTNYPSVVALHCHRKRTPPIATVGGTRLREEVITEHEKHQCHDAAIQAKRRCEMRKTDPLSVPLLAGMRHMAVSYTHLTLPTIYSV